MKMLHLNFVLFKYNMMQASKANESVSEYSKTGLCHWNIFELQIKHKLHNLSTAKVV